MRHICRDQNHMLAFFLVHIFDQVIMQISKEMTILNPFKFIHQKHLLKNINIKIPLKYCVRSAYNFQKKK